jgi:multiple sugar transport system substrate-binding protein
MKKLSVLFCVIPFVTMGIFANGGSEQTASGAAASGGQKVLKYWNMQWGNDRYPAIDEELAREYGKIAGLTIEYQCIPWANYYQIFTTAVASNTNPDVSGGSGYMPFQFDDAGLLEHMDDIYDKLIASGEIKDFYETYTRLYYNGHYISLPWNVPLRVLGYNKEIIKNAGIKLPTTWAEFREAAKATTRGDVYGFALCREGMGWQAIVAFMQNNHGGWFKPNKELNILDPKNLEALAFLTDLARDGSMNPAGAGMTSNEVERLFESGRLAFFFNTPNYLVSVNKSKGYDYAGIVSPLASPSGTKGTHYGINHIFVYKNSNLKQEAKDFALWWVRNNLKIFTEGGSGEMPAYLPHYQDKFYDNEIFRTAQKEWVPVGRIIASQYPTSFGAIAAMDADPVLIELAQGVTMKVDPAESLRKVNDAFARIMNK